MNAEAADQTKARQMTGAKMVVEALKQQGVEVVFGYPGGAVLPIYDEVFQQNAIRHILVRHEQGAVHAAEGYARATGKPGVVLVTSGPGATNAVTGLTDALMDSIPIVVLTGQVPTFMIGSDAFQEADTVGITRPCTKMNWLVKDTDRLSGTIHEAFHIATQGRPGPVLVDIPKDVQFATGTYTEKPDAKLDHYQPRVKGDTAMIEALVEAMETAERPVFYTGGGVINSGPKASELLRKLAEATGFPVTSTLMGLGAYPASGEKWMGMLGMHGLYEANLAMHGCDLMINVGARFDDRITGRIAGFQPEFPQGAYRHRPVVHQQGDPRRFPDHRRRDPCAGGGAAHLEGARPQDELRRRADLVAADRGLAQGRLPAYTNSETTIKPQYALERLEALTKDRTATSAPRSASTRCGPRSSWASRSPTAG
jgi:acetolactate synthase-1/2/3 large subunit